MNLSGRVVGDRSLPAEVTTLLAQRGLSADALVLEITETALIIERERAVEVLQSLRASGVRVELDDFAADLPRSACSTISRSTASRSTVRSSST